MYQPFTYRFCLLIPGGPHLTAKNRSPVLGTELCSLEGRGDRLVPSSRVETCSPFGFPWARVGTGPDGPVGSGGVFCVLAGTSRPSGSVPSPQSDVHTSPVDPVAGSSGCCRNALTSACKTAGPAFDRFLFLTQPPAQPSQHRPPCSRLCPPTSLSPLSALILLRPGQSRQSHMVVGLRELGDLPGQPCPARQPVARTVILLLVFSEPSHFIRSKNVSLFFCVFLPLLLFLPLELEPPTRITKNSRYASISVTL